MPKKRCYSVDDPRDRRTLRRAGVKVPPWFRCWCCERRVRGRGVQVPWSRAKPGPGVPLVAMCRACARLRRPGETGRALARRVLDAAVDLVLIVFKREAASLDLNAEPLDRIYPN